MGSPPVATARGSRVPTGIKLDDGYQTLIAFTANQTVEFWEKTVQPPGLEGGDPIDTTTMHNTEWRTFASRVLKTMTNATATVAYDPNAFEVVRTDLLNVEGVVTLHFPDTSTLAFYGYLQTFEPQDTEEGSQPEANITVVCTNNDPTDGSEQDPVLVSAVGT